MSDFLGHCRDAIGAANVVSASAEIAPHVADWRGRKNGKALAVLKPASTSEVAQIVRLCARFEVPLVPQGGNTGLALGGIPDERGNAIVLSLTRMNRIRGVDPFNNTMVVEAGCILETVRAAAASGGRLFPLSIGSRGSCTIGGNLATNAGGTAVLQYGSMRNLCLGIEAVTADGEIWDGLRALRKDNTGYDLRDLLIGSEGTLAVITAAVLKLVPIPASKRTVLMALRSVEDAVHLLELCQRRCGAMLTGFELMSSYALDLVARHFPAMRSPFNRKHPYCALLELSDPESDQHASALLESLASAATELGLLLDAAVASSEQQSGALWALREHIPLAQAAEGGNIKHDIALPISHIPGFVQATNQTLEETYPGCRIVCYGHLGDGNLHYNVMPAEPINPAIEETISRLVHDGVARFNGSFSAEHGIGAMKVEELCAYRPAVELSMMRKIKQALDPQNILNPGKILTDPRP
jgi:FAD/FMN-containing dehydrogenase